MPMKHYCNLERVLLCHLLLVLLPRQPHHRPQVATSCHLIPLDPDLPFLEFHISQIIHVSFPVFVLFFIHTIG